MGQSSVASRLVDRSLLREDAMVAGNWCQGTYRRVFPVTNPATGEVIAEVADIGIDQIRASIVAADTQVAFVDGLMEEIGLPLKNLGSAGGMSFRNFPAVPGAPKSGKDDD